MDWQHDMSSEFHRFLHVVLLAASLTTFWTCHIRTARLRRSSVGQGNSRVVALFLSLLEMKIFWTRSVSFYSVFITKCRVMFLMAYCVQFACGMQMFIILDILDIFLFCLQHACSLDLQKTGEKI